MYLCCNEHCTFCTPQSFPSRNPVRGSYSVFPDAAISHAFLALPWGGFSGLIKSGGKRPGGNLTTACKYLNAFSKTTDASIPAEITSDIIWSSGHKLQLMSFSQDTKKNFFIRRTVQQWTLPREALWFLSQQVSFSRLDTTKPLLTRAGVGVSLLCMGGWTRRPPEKPPSQHVSGSVPVWITGL